MSSAEPGAAMQKMKAPSMAVHSGEFGHVAEFEDIIGWPTSGGGVLGGSWDLVSKFNVIT